MLGTQKAEKRARKAKEKANNVTGEFNFFHIQFSPNQIRMGFKPVAVCGIG